ncbi:MAG: hypothetical protein ABI723_22720 [Bacteroidia bacterium]
MEQDIFMNVCIPLLGVKSEEDISGFLTKDLEVIKPSLEGWEFLNQPEVFSEQQRQGIPMMVNEENIPYCIQFTLEDIEDKSNVQRKKELIKITEQVVLSLQLYKEGWFFNPQQYQLFFVLNENGVFKGRYTGPFRQINFDQFNGLFPKQYYLNKNDLTINNAMIMNTPFANTYKIVSDYNSITPNSSVDYAIKNFRMSYNLFGGYSHRVNFLFTMIDCILGDLKARKIHKTQVNVRFLQRANIILSDYPNCDDEINWLVSDAGKDNYKSSTEWKLIGARVYRNLIAHGNAEDADFLIHVNEHFERIQNIARHLLKKYILFYFFTETKPDQYNKLNFSNDKLLSEKFYLFIEGVKEQKIAHIELLNNINRFIC